MSAATTSTVRLSVEAHAAAMRRGAVLRVINYHATPVGGAAALERELEAYAEHFAPVRPADLDRWFDTGEWPLDRPGLLPVFYEGYRNHASVAAPVCQRLGLVGWFFVITGFVGTPVAEQEAFARSHWISLVEEDLRGERIAMTWDEVAEVADEHVVVAHTTSHEGLDSVLDDADLEREVAEPARQLASVTGATPPAFAWFAGTSYGRSIRHDRAVVDAGYRFQFSNTMIQRLPDEVSG